MSRTVRLLVVVALAAVLSVTAAAGASAKGKHCTHLRKSHLTFCS